jgi:hypothetical protein
MATLTESTQQAGANDKAAGLIAAIGLLSGEQNYTFELYQRLVLPIDGFVFWVKASAVNPAYLNQQYSALYSTPPLNAAGYDANEPVSNLTPAQETTFSFQTVGSLHTSQAISEEESTTYTSQRILFTTKTQVDFFAAIAPDQLYITTIPNGSRVAFGSQANHYHLAGLWHYTGKAVYSTLFSQIIDDPRTLAVNTPIVSNSLPFWLAMSTPSVPVYPSYLSPLNQIPPYVTADIKSTTAMGQSPLYTQASAQSQLVTDVIRFTSYGLNNDAILDFQRMILQNSLLSEDYGIMNMPVPVDGKLPQVEFQVIAQMKTMQLQVNYYQNRARNLARQLIDSALINMNPIPPSMGTPFYA